MKKLNSTDAAKVLGMDYNTLYCWKRKRILVPSVNTKRRKNTISQYSMTDMLAGLILQNLRECGISQVAARQAVRKIQRFKGPYDDARLVIGGGEVVEITTTDAAFVCFYREHQHVFVAELAQALQEVEERMDKILSDGVGLAEAI